MENNWEGPAGQNETKWDLMSGWTGQAHKPGSGRGRKGYAGPACQSRVLGKILPMLWDEYKIFKQGSGRPKALSERISSNRMDSRKDGEQSGGLMVQLWLSLTGQVMSSMQMNMPASGM